MSVLHGNSVHPCESTAFASPHDTSQESEDSIGPSDKRPVLAYRGQTTCEQEALFVDRERFTRTRRSCAEPDRSVGKERDVGELSLFSEEKCLSLRLSILLEEAKSGKAQSPTTT